MFNANNYLKRLITFPLIKPIINQSWHMPQQPLKGVGDAELAKPVESDLISPLTIKTASDYCQRHHSSALLIMHDGKLIYENYYGGFTAQNGFNSMSMMKTVVGLLVGIAINEGLIDSIDTPAADFLPEWQDEERKKISIYHLLSMQSGLYSDVALSKSFLDIIPLYLGDDIGKKALSIKAVAKPGNYLMYNNVNSQLLGIILERATGMRYGEYLSQKLWQPLGCQDASLWIDNKGLPRTFAALFARAQDWLKVGQLVANDGLFNGQQLVPKDWVEEMKRGQDKDKRYGLHLWTRAHVFAKCPGIPSFEYYPASEEFDDPDTVFFEGMRMQCLTWVPSHKLLVLRVGERPNRDWDNTFLVNTITRGINS